MELTKAFSTIEADLKSIEGNLGFYFKDLNSGKTYDYRGNESFGAASVIKLPILLSVFRFIHRGEASPEDLVRVYESDKVPSCGAIRFFPGDFDVPLKTLYSLMISISDNTATNVIIRHFGIENLKAEFDAMGLKKTVLRRILFDDEASAKGIENSICPVEIGELLEQIYRQEFLSPVISNKIRDILLSQQICHKIPGGVNDDSIEVANKTGEDDNLTNDVGIVYTKNPFILCFAGSNTDVAVFNDFIRRTSAILAKIENN